MPKGIKGFQKGQKGLGGLRNPPGGRPTKEQAAEKQKKAEIEKRAAEMAKEFIETHCREFLESYLNLGTGKGWEERLDKDGSVVKLNVLDAATVRHAIDKLVPDAKQTIAIEHEGLEELMRKAKERRGR